MKLADVIATTAEKETWIFFPFQPITIEDEKKTSSADEERRKK